MPGRCASGRRRSQRRVADRHGHDVPARTMKRQDRHGRWRMERMRGDARTMRQRDPNASLRPIVSNAKPSLSSLILFSLTHGELAGASCHSVHNASPLRARCQGNPKSGHGHAQADSEKPHQRHFWRDNRCKDARRAITMRSQWPCSRRTPKRGVRPTEGALRKMEGSQSPPW